MKAAKSKAAKLKAKTKTEFN
jgi:hypothetical protein